MTEFLTPLSFGEVADRVSILQIKYERIREPEKRVNVEARLAQLGPALFQHASHTPGFAELFAQLKAINERLWDMEDELRRHESRKDFGPEFIQLARSVYLTNDERMRIKRALDELFGSSIVEEKSYVRYGSSKD